MKRIIGLALLGMIGVLLVSLVCISCYLQGAPWWKGLIIFGASAVLTAAIVLGVELASTR